MPISRLTRSAITWLEADEAELTVFIRRLAPWSNEDGTYSTERSNQHKDQS